MRPLALARLLAAPLAAQQPPVAMPDSRADRFLRYCDEYSDRDREQVCEVRDVTMKAPTRALLVDGRDNGSVRVYGWDKNEVLVRALITTSAEDRRDALDMAKDIKIEAANERIRADGPSSGRRRSWSVSFEVWVPRKTSLDAETSNGSVNLDIPKGFNARLETGTVNGGMSIDFPITIQGSITRRISTTLGSGGPRRRAVTTNGTVRIRQL